MDRPEEEDEERLLTRRLIEGLRYTFTKFTVSIDEGERDDEVRPFERFDIFFMIPESCQSLDGRDIDSILLYEMIIFESVQAIEKRYKQLLPGLREPARGLGIHKETLWRFGDDVPEAEGMLGDPEEPGDYPACFTFWARFALRLNQHASRCRTAPVYVPREIPQRTGTDWVVTEEGLIREVVAVDKEENKTPLHWRKFEPAEEPSKPHFYPEDERYGYEDEQWEEDEER